MKNSLKALFFATSIFLFLFDFSSCVIEPRPFYLTYESKYGIVPEKKKIPVNTVLTEKELPTLYSEDYTFKGWYEEGIKAEPNVYVVTKNAHFIANWEEIPKFEYKVKHWKQNLENDDYTLFKTETLFGKANDSTQAYSFDYEGFTSLYFDQQTIKNDNSTEVNIYYDRKIITLTFNSNGGSSVSSVTGKYGATVTKIETPIKEGYTFVDWQPTLPKTFPAQDTTYKARWSLSKNYSIIYNLDGGENSLENPISFNVETNDIILKAPTKLGYTFTGWVNEDGYTVTKIPKGTTGNITLTATWIPDTNIQYTIEHWQQNLENDDYSRTSIEYKTGTTNSFTKAVATEFEGFTSQNFEQQIINPDGSTLVQIYYDRKIVTLSFINENGTIFDSVTGKYGALIPSIEIPTREGYAFVDWQPTLPTTFPAQNISFTIMWKLETDYSIKYNLDGGENSLENPYSFNIETNDIILKAPTKLGYTFTGWINEDGYTVTKIPKGTIGNITLTATWTPNSNTQYTVEYWWQNTEDDNYSLASSEYKTGTTNSSTNAVATEFEGFISKDFEQQTINPDGSTTVQIYYDRKIFTLSLDGYYSIYGKYGSPVNHSLLKPTRKGYTFVEWQPAVPNTIPAEDQSFTAIWTPNSNTDYTIEYWWQNTKDNEYTLVDVDLKKGTTDSLTEAEIKEFVGFYTPEVEQQIIQADGSTIVQIFYDRKLITLSILNEDGTVFDSVTGKYGAPVTIETPSHPDYTFVKWQETPPTTFPSEDQSYTAIWVQTNLISTSETVVNDILTLQGEGPHDIVLVGEISYETMQTIVEAMRTNVNAKVNLDLELTTNYDYIYTYTAFYDCTNLTSIKLPENTIHISQSAFDGCSSLTSITIPKNVEFVGVCAFNRCNNLTQFIVDENNPYFSSSDDGKILFNKDKTTLVSYPSATEDITIPYGVTTIAQTAFSYCENLLSVTIPNSVTYIGNEAFSSCTNLTNIIIPNSVTSIEQNTFLYCSNLTSITLPNSITSIGYSAFHGCSGLESITIPNSVTSIGSHAFANCTNLTEIVLPNSVTTIENNTFEYCENLTTITLPNSITSIGYSAFCGCSSLESITIPNNVTVISSHAFANCTNLTEIVLPASVTTIENNAFQYCENLTTITLPNSITSIGSYAFYYCSKLTEISIPNGVTTIESDIFSQCYALTNVTLPDSITSIGSCAFQSCRNLESIIIPDSVTSIGSGAFCGCNSLESIIIPNGIKTIESSTFAYCYNLSSVTIPDSVTVIGSSAFDNCTSLTEVILPNSVTTIDSGAFYGCNNLESVNIPNNVTYIGSNAFYGCKISEVTLPDTISTIGYQAYLSCYNLTTINIPASVTSIESAAFQGCTNLTTFNVDPNNKYYSTSDDKRILYNKDKTILLSYPTAEGNISIPAGVEKIEDGAFSSCRNLIQIELPNSITYIGNSAFSDCSNLTEINIPFGVTYIGDSAFWYCYALQNIELPNNVTSIGVSTFFYCSNLMNITLPQNLETIGDSAFYGCSSLTNISIPASVTTIGNHAFMYCTSLIFSIAANNEYYSNSDDGSMLLNKDKTILITYPSASGDIVISENVTTIGDYAFVSCNNLKKVTLPKNLTSIESYAFAHCYSLENIIIPTKVSTIGSYAFYCCDNLQNVIFRDPTTWYYTYNSDYIYGTEIAVTDEYQNAFYLRNNYDWYWYKE